MDLGGLLLGAVTWAQVAAQTAAIRWGGNRAIAIVMAVLAAGLALVTIRLWWRRRRRSRHPAPQAAEAPENALRQRLRRRLAEPLQPFTTPTIPGPTLGAGAALEADFDAAARRVLPHAGWRCGAARQLLRQRLNGHHAAGDAGQPPGGGAEPPPADDGEAACWRQLGALALLDNVRDAVAAYARAAELAPDDADLQMLLAVLYLRNGQVEMAEATLRRQIERTEGREGAEPVRYRLLTVLGDVLLATGARADALAAYEAGRKAVLALAEAEPEAGRWQRDAALSHDRIGELHLAEGELDLALASYRRSLELSRALAQAAPADSGLQHDLSVAHDRIGEILDRKGDLDGALESYRQALSHAEALVLQQPEHADRQWDLSASLDRVGDILAAKGKAADALGHYRRALEIAEALLARDPMRVDWQRDLAVTCHKIGMLEAECGHEAEARNALERGRAIIAHLDEIARHQAQWRADLARFDAALRTLGQ